MQFIELLLWHAQVWPNKIAVAQINGRAITYQGLLNAIGAVGGRLAREKITKDDFVSIEIKDPIKRLVVHLALLRSAVCSVNANQEISSHAVEIGATVLLHESEGGADKEGVRKFIVDESWFISSEKGMLLAKFDAGKPAVVWFSSGSTGRPKPFALSGQRLDAKVTARASIFCETSFDRVMVLPSVVSSFGMICVLASLSMGESVFLVESESDVLTGIAQYRADYLVASTYQLFQMIEAVKAQSYDFSSLRGGYVGGGLAAPAMLSDALAHVLPRFLFVYASTEAGDTALGQAATLLARAGSVGWVAPFVEVEVVDDRQIALAPGREGSIRIRSKHAAVPFSGLHERYDQKDNWIYPGDSGFLTENNQLVLVGRVSDVINMGGVKASAEVIENEMRQIAHIHDIAVVSAIPADGGMEQIDLFAVADPLSEASIRQLFGDKFPQFPIARIYFQPSLPRLPSGKLDREKLRASVSVPITLH